MVQRPFTRLAALFWLALMAGHVHAGVDLTPCTLKGSQGYGQVEAQCGKLQRPENPDDPAGTQIELFVARVQSLSPEPLADAFTIINGGPGASSVSLYVDFAGAFSGILRERDIVIVDQRGTGRSNPLECSNLGEASEGVSEDLIKSATHECLESLAADPRFYSTSQAVSDLDAVRDAFGYAALNVYGVSYGTRVAMHYLRRYPERVRSLVIDGVVPPDLALGMNVAENAQATLDAIFLRCVEDAACVENFPDLENTFAKLQKDLKSRSVSMNIAHPVTGAIEHLDFSYDHLAVTIRLMSYAPETASLIPLIISETSRGNYTPAASQALKIVEQLNGAISYAMHNSVVCTEDLPFAKIDDEDWRRLEKTYLGADQVRALQTICSIWPTANMDSNLKDPLHADTPVLLLSGEFDPVTPPRYGQRVSANLTNSRHIIASGQGHGIIARGCIARLVTEFVQAGRWEELDISCADRLAPQAFFVNLLGPTP